MTATRRPDLSLVTVADGSSRRCAPIGTGDWWPTASTRRAVLDVRGGDDGEEWPRSEHGRDATSHQDPFERWRDERSAAVALILNTCHRCVMENP
jgi:hypothetical protein